MLNWKIILRIAPQSVDPQIEFNHPVCNLRGLYDEPGHLCSFQFLFRYGPTRGMSIIMFRSQI